MTSASVPALPVDVWSHVAQFLPVRDRVALLDASVSTREAVLRATKRRISDFLDGREHFFHHPGGAPCVDVEANASFARGLLRHAEYVLPCADAEAVLLAAMSSAFADSFDDVRLADAASQRESERTDCVARFMVMASKDMSDRMKGKMVGIFLQLDIDLLEKEDAGAISVESRRQDFDADFEYEDEQKVERSNAARLLFRAKMRIFVIIHVVLGCETLAHLRSDYDPDADLQSHFKWQSFTTSFLGLLSTRRSTSVGLLRTLTMPNLRWYALRVTRVLAKRRKDDKGECATSASIMVKIFGLKSIDEEMDAYEQNDIKAFTNIQALESVDDFNFNLGEVYSPAEVFNINIVALSKFLVLIPRETNLEETSFTAVVSYLTKDWDPTFKLILLGYLWETCPETEYVLKDFMATHLVPEPIVGESGQRIKPALGSFLDVSAVRIGRMLLSLFEQRHHVRLTPTTCVAMFELASSVWSERNRTRIVWCIHYHCHVEQYLKLNVCSEKCCANGVNENVLALILFLVDHKERVSCQAKRDADAEDCAREKSMRGLLEHAERELDLFSQREREGRLRPHAWVTREV